MVSLRTVHVYKGVRVQAFQGPTRQAYLVRDTTPAMSTIIDEKNNLEEEPVVVHSYGLTSSQASGTERRAEEKRLVRKLDRRVLPVLCAMYLFSCVYLPSLPTMSLI